MSYDEKTFCVCDGCGVEEEVQPETVPNAWVSVVKQQHGGTFQHFCSKCWFIGYTAICNHVVNNGPA